MELFLEITRRCNMQCQHCLRGDAQGVDMSAEVMRNALRMFSEAYSLGFGGGEALLKPKLIHTFAQELSWSTSTLHNQDAPMWIVSNGKRFMDQVGPSIPYNDQDWDYNEDDDPENIGPRENIPLVDAIERLSMHVPITLAISTDQFHEDGAELRKNHVSEIFEYNENVTVVSHGPSGWDNLLRMGNSLSGKELTVYSPKNDDSTNMVYVDVHGYIWPDCNLSYKFMADFRDSKLCLGNVLTDTIETVDANMYLLDDILQGGSVLVGEDWIDDFIELELVHNEEKELIKN